MWRAVRRAHKGCAQCLKRPGVPSRPRKASPACVIVCDALAPLSSSRAALRRAHPPRSAGTRPALPLRQRPSAGLSARSASGTCICKTECLRDLHLQDRRPARSVYQPAEPAGTPPARPDSADQGAAAGSLPMRAMKGSRSQASRLDVVCRPGWSEAPTFVRSRERRQDQVKRARNTGWTNAIKSSSAQHFAIYRRNVRAFYARSLN